MHRQTADRLCKLCPKGEFAGDFGSPYCAPCPRHHTTRGLGSRAESDCYYHHSSNDNNAISKSNSKDNYGSRSTNNFRNVNKDNYSNRKANHFKERGKDTVPAPARNGPTVINGPRATARPPKTTSLKKNRLGFMYYNMWNRRKSGSDNSARTASSDARSY